MGKRRPVDVVDLTGAGIVIDLTVIDLTSDVEPLSRVICLIQIPWISKLPKHDPSKKLKWIRPWSVKEKLMLSELRKDAAWFEDVERRFKAALPS